MKMKKVLLAVLLVSILTVGAASAGGWKGHGGRMRGHGMEGGVCFMYGGRGLFNGPHGGRMRAGRADGAKEIPQEIREKFAEAQKTAIDLRTELGRTPLNREKALELHAKHHAIMQEICDWHFTQRLDALTDK